MLGICIRVLATMSVIMLTTMVVRADIRVGAAKVDVTPNQLPVLVNGSMTSKSADSITTRIHARAIVVDDGNTRIGLCVVDSCMLPKQLCDEAKSLTASRTQLSAENLMVSATHTHSAPSSMGALGTDADLAYASFVRQKIAEAFVEAESNLQPARFGWASADAANFTALRRWVRRPDRVELDPFGNRTVRAMMHAARNPDDAVGPSGPEDPELSLIAFETLQGKPLAVLCNFSMHYFGGEKPISADYFGYFCQQFESFLAPDSDHVVAIMSHGCSGDIWKRDYMVPRAEAEGTIQEYSSGLLDIAQQAYQGIEFQDHGTLAMQEARLKMSYRTPDNQRLAWAKQVVAEMGNRLPQSQPEIYAREQVYLDRLQSTEVVVQAMRIGDIAIATTPCETYALSGLKIKLQSPLDKVMVIELANGGDGYIPPPEQHALGGYNTWPARSAGLEIDAEPRIVAACLQLLEAVCDQDIRPHKPQDGSHRQAIRGLQPVAYWQLDELQPGFAWDSSGQNHHALYEPDTLYFLPGPEGFVDLDALPLRHGTNRAVHFADGRIRFRPTLQIQDFSVLLSFWNGMPLGSRNILGWIMSIDHDRMASRSGMHLGLNQDGRLAFQFGHEQPVFGTSMIERWKWNRLAMVRSGTVLKVLLAGKAEAELVFEVPEEWKPQGEWFFGGRSDRQNGWQGRLDEILLFDRVLNPRELRLALDLLEND